MALVIHGGGQRGRQAMSSGSGQSGAERRQFHLRISRATVLDRWGQ
jgi:hypothetical protein